MFYAFDWYHSTERDYYVNLLRSIMVSLVMQALEGKIQGFQGKSCPSSVNEDASKRLG